MNVNTATIVKAAAAATLVTLVASNAIAARRASKKFEKAISILTDETRIVDSTVVTAA